MDVASGASHTVNQAGADACCGNVGEGGRIAKKFLDAA